MEQRKKRKREHSKQVEKKSKFTKTIQSFFYFFPRIPLWCIFYKDVDTGSLDPLNGYDIYGRGECFNNWSGHSGWYQVKNVLDTTVSFTNYTDLMSYFYESRKKLYFQWRQRGMFSTVLVLTSVFKDSITKIMNLRDELYCILGHDVTTFIVEYILDELLNLHVLMRVSHI
jgi:hypothetical protein